MARETEQKKYTQVEEVTVALVCDKCGAREERESYLSEWATVRIDKLDKPWGWYKCDLCPRCYGEIIEAWKPRYDSCC